MAWICHSLCRLNDIYANRDGIDEATAQRLVVMASTQHPVIPEDDNNELEDEDDNLNQKCRHPFLSRCSLSHQGLIA